MERLTVIGFNHNSVPLKKLGELHLSEEIASQRLTAVKNHFSINEIAFLSTCNRVEFFIVSKKAVNVLDFLSVYLENDIIKAAYFSTNVKKWEGINAVNHIIEVASSVDSMVLGEREIITQLKSAFDYAHEHKLSGDFLRLVKQQTIKTAKRVFNTTFISEKSVSVVGLAFKQLQETGLNTTQRVLVIGAGVTNTTICKLLRDNGITEFTVFNRGKERGLNLANEINGQYFPLDALKNYKEPWDILVSCTSKESSIIDRELYKTLTKGDVTKKVIVDLAIPNDISSEVIDYYKPHYISIEQLKRISGENINARKRELLKVRQVIFEGLEEFKLLVQRRKIERKLNFIPREIKEIRKKAIDEVFFKEMANLNPESKEVLEKVLNYMEKKYISVPMKMAKELLTDKDKGK